jgi:exopolysaccharide production protein ExoY
MGIPTISFWRTSRFERPRCDPPVTAGWWLWAAGERVLSAAALAALSPYLLLTGIAVRWLSGSPPLVAHLRTGQGGEPFWMLKFRTMWDGTEPAGADSGFLVEYISSPGVPGLKSAGDPRVTSRFARFLRRYSLDELPQLAHVVTGRMSLVGPRPLLSSELEAYYGEDAWQVVSVKPGLTGLWQVSGRSRLPYPQRRELDKLLVENRSPKLFLKILARTIPAVVLGRDSW